MIFLMPFSIWRLSTIPTAVAWILGFAAVLMVFVTLVVSLRQYICPHTSDEKKNFVQLIFQVLGGSIVILGVYFTWEEFRTSRETLKNSQETIRTTQQGQITDRFTRAIDQLGKSDDVPGKANNLAIRLGGIYSLERIARDSVEADQSKEKNKGKNDHWVIMEILTTYIRQNAGWTVDKEKETVSPQISPDVQAILTVLGRRYLKYNEGESQRLNLRGTDMRGANLNEANLNGADLAGSHLDEAQLNGASLNQANFYVVSLKGAFLNRAQLKNAVLQGADMSEADLTNANLFGADLTGASLAGALLGGADLRCSIVTAEQLRRALTNAETKLPDPQMKCLPT